MQSRCFCSVCSPDPERAPQPIAIFVRQTVHKRTQLCHIANHSHILLVEVGICRGVQTQSLHLIPHNEPSPNASQQCLHSNLDDEQEATYAQQDVRGRAQLRSSRSVLLACRTVVAIIAEAASSLLVAVVATDATATAKLTVVFTTGDGARELRLHIDVVGAHGVLHDGGLAGERVRVVRAEEREAKASLIPIAHDVAATSVMNHHTRSRIIHIYESLPLRNTNR